MKESEEMADQKREAEAGAGRMRESERRATEAEKRMPGGPDGSTGGVGGEGVAGQVEKPRAALGRIVHYYETPKALPRTALIAYVHDNVLVNLAVFDHDGSFMGGSTSVLRRDAAVTGASWDWPPRV